MRRPRKIVTTALAALILTSCNKSCNQTSPTAPSGGGVPLVKHVFIVVEENANYQSVIGNAAMPYLNRLAMQYGLATQYYANTHPSIGNYFMLTAGEIVTNDDSYGSLVDTDNIVRALRAAGKTWKSYAEDLPAVGYTGDNIAGYVRRHNVPALLSDVVNDPTQVTNLVPFTQFGADLGRNAFPNYSFVVPNLCDDGHDCPLSIADAWLQTNIDPLINSATFSDALLIVLFDEALTDNTRGGGRVAWVVVGPKVKRGYQSTIVYQHESTLRLTARALGLLAAPNQAATALDMNEFFTP
ncbi:MAG: hypothetical protein HY047_02490 [Acidobacteria bacterium]|nr:hypothetical protein [Acidobacteriota bacterium]